MTPHNGARMGDFAKTVLMPGDPLRSKFIAEEFLENPRLVNEVRNILGYTGTYMLIWYPVLDHAVELSSMGIRVDKEALLRQLEIEGEESRKELYFHKQLLDGKLPLTVGGGIGQSRLCMLMLHKAHVGEIQASIWPEEMRCECDEAGMPLI